MRRMATTKEISDAIVGLKSFVPVVDDADIGTLTWEQTIAKYGNVFVVVEGNAAQLFQFTPDDHNYISFINGYLVYGTVNMLALNYDKVSEYDYYSAPIRFGNVLTYADIGNNNIKYACAHSTLHIHGTFAPTANIAAGSKLFGTGIQLSTKMTHGSAINTGATGAETFVGISIQTNGDVYCLGALTSGVTYNIAVTATM